MKKCNIITLYERKARNNYLAFLSAVMLLAFKCGRFLLYNLLNIMDVRLN